MALWLDIRLCVDLCAKNSAKSRYGKSPELKIEQLSAKNLKKNYAICVTHALSQCKKTLSQNKKIFLIDTEINILWKRNFIRWPIDLCVFDNR